MFVFAVFEFRVFFVSLQNLFEFMDTVFLNLTCMKFREKNMFFICSIKNIVLGYLDEFLQISRNT